MTPSAWMLAFAKASEAVRRACANVSTHQMQHWEIGQSFCDVNSLSTDQDANPIPTTTLENYLSLFFVESGPQRFWDTTFFFPKSLSHSHDCKKAITWKKSLMLLILTRFVAAVKVERLFFPSNLFAETKPCCQHHYLTWLPIHVRDFEICLLSQISTTDLFAFSSEF